MAQARFRKAFRYPEDGDLPKDLDEEEQEKLIAKLKKENDDNNLVYLKLFIGTVAASASLFLPIFFGTQRVKPKLIALMGITSLALTIYMLVMIPTKDKPLPLRSLAQKFDDPFDLSPMQRWIPTLNGIVAAFVFLLGLEFRDHPHVHNGFWLVCILPLLMYTIIQFVRRFVVEVNLAELEGRRYEFKGA